MQKKSVSTSTLGKTELVKRISESSKLTGVQIGETIDKFLEEVKRGLKEGKPISLKEYFTLKIMKTKARIGVNQDTRKKINITKKKKVSFKVSENLKSELNNPK